MDYSVLRGRSVWITGASSGIGYEMALIAADAGASIVLISSREKALAETAKKCSDRGAKSVDYTAIDLSQVESAEAEVRTLLDNHTAPDFLILNAGISQRSRAGDTDFAVTRRIMDINFMSAVTLARMLIPAMIETGGGRIGITSSLVGEFGFPMRSAYSASKKALHGYFESVDLEYYAEGIRTTLVLPGRIRTSISTNALEGDGTRHGVMDQGQARGMDAGLCARRYWRAVIKGRRQAVIGGLDTLMVYFHRYVPWLFRIIARKASPL